METPTPFTRSRTDTENSIVTTLSLKCLDFSFKIRKTQNQNREALSITIEPNDYNIDWYYGTTLSLDNLLFRIEKYFKNNLDYKKAGVGGNNNKYTKTI